MKIDCTKKEFAAMAARCWDERKGSEPCVWCVMQDLCEKDGASIEDYIFACDCARGEENG